MNLGNHIDRNDFMSFFRNTERLNTLSNDDRLEVFSYILSGSSDISKELLESIICDYSQGTLKVIELDHG